MQADLKFKDPILEARYEEHHADQQKNMEINFHFARALAWAAVCVRAFAGRQYQDGVITLLGALTTVSPSFIIQYAPKSLYLRWRPVIIGFDNVLQVALGCYTHEAIYPSTMTGSWRSVFVLLSGNGVAWLLWSSLWGSLIFRYMFPQQAALTIILLMYNGTLCRSSAALVQAYEALKATLGWAMRTVLEPHQMAATLDFLRTMPVLTNPVAATVAAACSSGNEGAAAEEWAAASCAAGDAPQQSLLVGEALCMVMQPLTLLIFGFMFPTFYIFATELRSRRMFVKRIAGRALGEAWLDESEFSVSLIDYFLFGIPALACMLLYVVATS